MYIYIAPRQRLTTPWGRNLYVNRNIVSLQSFVASFKIISLKSDLIQFFFMILYMYIAPRQGQTAPREQSFDINRNVLVTLFIVCLINITCDFSRLDFSDVSRSVNTITINQSTHACYSLFQKCPCISLVIGRFKTTA